jgi:integrase/recombinase XerD
MNKEIDRAELQHDYETYLRRQRGRTIFHSWRIADRFLEFRFGKEIGDLSRITTTDRGPKGQSNRRLPHARAVVRTPLRSFRRQSAQGGGHLPRHV